MTTTATVLLILLLYLGVMFLFGRLSMRHSQSFQATITASGQVTALMLVGNFVAGQIGSGFVIGGAEYGALYGIGGGWYGIACALSAFVGAAMSKFIYEHQYISLSDFFAVRYATVSSRLIYSISTICCGIALLSGQLLAARSVLETLGLSATWGVILIALSALIYANLTGLLGSMRISTVQAVVIFAGMMAAIAVMLSDPGPGVLSQSLPPSYFDPVPFDREFLVATTMPLLLSSTVSQYMFQSISSARSMQTARLGYIAAGICLLPIALIPPALGMFGRSFYPELPASQVFTNLLLNRLPTVVGAVILAAVLCAVLVSCNSAYIMVATILVHDIYQGIFAPEADSKTCKRMMLTADIIICAMGVWLALRMNDIIGLLSIGYSLVAAGCLVPFFGGALWKRGTARGAMLASCVGMLASLADSLNLIDLPYACITSILLSAAAYILGSLWSKPSNR